MKSVKNFAIFNIGYFGFDFFKKSVVIFFALLLSINGFIPKSQNFKDVLFKAVNCAVNTVEFNFIDGYAKRISGVTNTIAAKVLKALKSAGLTQPQISKGNNKNNNEPVNRFIKKRRAVYSY